ncbi:MFS transporter [Arthrobacter sp. StoSoilB13]|uniref:MFS transporter n=1 Tax=Arthrobacter sp. StoSoilB13 TaxID=2830993 RepID=UPI001CC374EC|nr:MFS transporter [Arthrobacter sp. StoSoilB13]BCW48839.1 MFS transporter [Arthrobacter sp. StoSoilB13]
MYISLSDRSGGKREKPRGATTALSSEVPFRLSPVILWLGLVSMVTDVSSESVTAILPLYVTGFLGLSTIAFGFIDGINQGASAIVRIAAGWASDRSGHPKRIAFAGYGLSMLARIGFLFAGGFWAIAAIVTGDRIGKGIRTAPRDALITVSAQPEHLARSFGVHRMLDNIGAAAGPMIAFLVLLLIPNGFSTVFVVSLAFAVIGVAVLGLVVPDLRADGLKGIEANSGAEQTAGSRKKGPRLFAFSWSHLREPGLGKLLISAGLLGLLTIGDGFIYLVLQDRDSFAVQWFPLLFVGTNIVFLAFAIPLGRLADRVGRVPVFVGGHIALLACYFLAAAPFGGLWSTVGCLILLGGFYAATDGVLAALASQLTPSGKLATGIASAQTVVALSRMTASAGFGVLWYAVGASTAMVAAGALLACAVVAVVFILPGARPKLGSE